jgi:hypothetical protein
MTEPRPRLDRAIDWLVGAENPAGTVYGTLSIGALLAAESGLRDTYPETIGSATLALALYWLGHSYSDLLGHRLDTGQRLTVTDLMWFVLRDSTIPRGACLPLLALLIAWVVGAEQSTGVSAAVWTAAASLLAFELLAGLRARAQPGELVLEGCVGAVMGLGIIALRAILH